MTTEAVFTQVLPIRSFEGVVAQIREAIYEGKLRNGDKLSSERELCLTFGVSRQTLREALRWLEAMGLIEIRLGAQGGIFVVEPDGGQAGSAIDALIRFHQATPLELEEFRASFEAETAYWAAQRAEEADLIRLQQIVGQLAQGVANPLTPWAEISDLDLKFHTTVAEASKNRVRLAIMLGVHQAIKRASRALDPLMSDEVRRSIVEELAAVVRAISQRDPLAAHQHMAAHVRRFAQMEAALPLLRP